MKGGRAPELGDGFPQLGTRAALHEIRLSVSKRTEKVGMPVESQCSGSVGMDGRSRSRVRDSPFLHSFEKGPGTEL